MDPNIKGVILGTTTQVPTSNKTFLLSTTPTMSNDIYSVRITVPKGYPKVWAVFHTGVMFGRNQVVAKYKFRATTVNNPVVTQYFGGSTTVQWAGSFSSYPSHAQWDRHIQSWASHHIILNEEEEYDINIEIWSNSSSLDRGFHHGPGNSSGDWPSVRMTGYGYSG